MDKKRKEFYVEDRNIVNLYRAVGSDEWLGVMKSNKFSLLDGGLEVKYFGLNLEETIKFTETFAGKELGRIR